MKRKKVRRLVMLLFICLSFASCSSGEAGGSFKDKAPQDSNIEKEGKVQVFTSFYPMYDFTKKIGGDHVEVTNLIPAGIEPHDWEPSPQDLVRLQEASIFVVHGMGMEPWADTLVQSSRNANQILVVASRGIKAIQGNRSHSHEQGEDDEEHSPTMEAEEEEMDPHAWLDPMLAKIEMENIKNALVQVDPQHEADYENNYAEQLKFLNRLDDEYRTALEKTKRKDFVVSHEAFGYLAQAYGLNQIGIEGLSPDTEPSPTRMAEIIDFCKANQIKVIFFEELVSPKVAQIVAQEAGAKTMVLNPIEGLTQEEMEKGNDYYSIMKNNLENLLVALNN